jgi:RNA-directed DNA polymerase
MIIKGTNMNSGEPKYSHKECTSKPIDGKGAQGIIFWQSDYPIVSKRSLKDEGEKGIAVIQSDVKETRAGHRTGEWVRTKLASITLRSKEEKGFKFTSLSHLLSESFLKDCFQELKRDKATGIDGVSIAEYEDNINENIKVLVERLRSKKYIPQPVKRRYIPKTDGTKRGLGIPTTEDKIVQMGIKKILESIYEVEFEDISYGFRPGRSCHTALERLNKEMLSKPINYVLDIDIEKYFDSIDHKKLIQCIEMRIRDSSLIRLIIRFLKAGVMEEGKYHETEMGTPQGGIISPILANIYLHYVLDKWYRVKMKKEIRGYTNIIRYCDDFIILTQYKTEAYKIYDSIKARLRDCGLEISEKKSSIIEFGKGIWVKSKESRKEIKTFDFLGFTHYCGRSLKGNFKLGRKTSKKKFKQKLVMMNDWLKKTRNAVRVEKWIETIKKKLIGHYNYYGISENYKGIERYYNQTIKLIYKWINRRSQKKSYNWDKFSRFIKYQQLPKPKIYHSLYTPSSYKGRITEEPYVGKLQVRFCEGS